jgi:hypothetical protein
MKPMICKSIDDLIHSESYPPQSRDARRVVGASFSAKRAAELPFACFCHTGEERMTYLRVYLKVCEGCGGLWFRTQDRIDVYCPSCAEKLQGFPKMVRKKRGRPCKHSARPASAIGGGR